MNTNKELPLLPQSEFSPAAGYTADQMRDYARAALAQQAPAALTDAQLDAVIEASLPELDEQARKALTFIRWRDGIDCDYVTVGARRFVREVLARAHGTAATSEPAAASEAAIRADERERCAKLCELNAKRWPVDERAIYVANECAAAIRQGEHHHE